MLPTFVIGLREGLEAALIVGIIAAFLRSQGRRDLLRWVLGGVTLAVLLCVGAGIALRVFSQDLPQRQQEGLETVIGALAVLMVTYMVIWMRRHSRDLKGQLEGLASEALDARGSAARALVLMAFLAVIREGLETVVFVLAAFNEASNGTTAGIGLLLGLALAVALGYGIYRGGVRINLSRFFRVTGVVLVLVAAGLVVNALHTAHEAGWLQAGQGRTFDLTWLVDPGSVQSSLLTGMLGLQPYPVTIEVVGWLVYLIPVGLYVAWPPKRVVPKRVAAIIAAAVAVSAGASALGLALTVPARPALRPVTDGGSVRAQVVDRSGAVLRLRTAARQPVAGTSGPATVYSLHATGPVQHAGEQLTQYRGDVPGSGTADRPRTLDVGQVARLNGGRLPVGVASSAGQIGVTYADAATLTAWVDPRTDRVVDLSWRETVSATLHAGSLSVPLDAPVQVATTALPAAARNSAAAAVAADRATADDRSGQRQAAVWLTVLAALAALTAAGFGLAQRRRPAPAPEPGSTPVFARR